MFPSRHQSGVGGRRNKPQIHERLGVGENERMTGEAPSLSVHQWMLIVEKSVFPQPQSTLQARLARREESPRDEVVVGMGSRQGSRDRIQKR